MLDVSDCGQGAFRKETHVDSHAHRGVTVVTLVHRTRHRSRGRSRVSRTARISAPFFGHTNSRITISAASPRRGPSL